MEILRASVIGALSVSAAAGFPAAGAQADVPRIAADIAPVASLVARVMEGVDGAGPVEQVIRAGASPHGYAMRPSEAAALEQARPNDNQEATDDDRNPDEEHDDSCVQAGSSEHHTEDDGAVPRSG